MKAGRHYTITYELELEDNQKVSYDLQVDKDTLISSVQTTGEPPAWTRLEHEKCRQCPLTDTEHCPIALRLVEPVNRFRHLLSHTATTTTVVAPERTYTKEVDVQNALRSLFGLIMATSGCPLMQPFRFMARYHLPFATLDETIARITSTYLMGQFFRSTSKSHVPVNIHDIDKLYNTIKVLNEHMALRLRSVAEGDGSLNAIVILSTYSSLIPIIIDSELENLKKLFE